MNDLPKVLFVAFVASFTLMSTISTIVYTAVKYA